MGQIVRRLGLAGLMVVALSFAFATVASAQMREFTGRIERVSAGQLVVGNRAGDQLSFAAASGVVVRGAKSSWGELAKGDFVTVSWKLDDEPRKAHAVVVRPPRSEQ